MIEVARSITSGDAIRVLDFLFNVYGTPACIKSDNGPQFVMGDSLAANLVLPMQKRWPDKNIMQATALDYIPGNSFKCSPIAKALD
jgi:hypothetical protein